MEASPAILVLNQSSLHLAKKIQVNLGGEIHGFKSRVNQADIVFTETAEHVQDLFQQQRPIIGICAAGILIRALGTELKDKHTEPPVIAISEDSANIVPLLGGHHGANKISHKLAKILNGHAGITTAGDTKFGISFEDPPIGWVLSNNSDVKSFTARLLAGESVSIAKEIDWIPTEKLKLSKNAELAIHSTTEDVHSTPTQLVYHPKSLAIGIGCVRGCETEELRNLVFDGLKQANLTINAVSCFVSLDLKADEVAINDLVKDTGIPLRLFDANQLEQETPRLINPSDIVFAEVGCHGVAESAALAATGNSSELIVSKIKSNNATCAIARASKPIDPYTIGRARGRLAVIGIGPGKDSLRTPEATKLLNEADEVVGYTLYLELISQHIKNKKIHTFPLGEEENRVRFALETAAQGKNVALVSSGDGGIYAMGSLVFELLQRPTEQNGVSESAHRIEIINAPGITAFQVASAKSGAPFGHDFCAISLSDLLTPWDIIEKRIVSAATGDFVIALYNPVSKRRTTQLMKAKEILLMHRPPKTPIVLATNLGREGEKIEFSTLENLKIDNINMLTTVLIGSTTTQILDSINDKTWIFTPRGYAVKQYKEPE